MNAKDSIAAVKKMEKPEDVQAFIAAENETETPRTSVIAAAESRMKELTTPPEPSKKDFKGDRVTGTKSGVITAEDVLKAQRAKGMTV